MRFGAFPPPMLRRFALNREPSSASKWATPDARARVPYLLNILRDKTLIRPSPTVALLPVADV